MPLTVCLVAQSCLTLCVPMNCSPPSSSAHEDSLDKNTGVGCHSILQGIFQRRDWAQVSFIAGEFFTIWATLEAKYIADFKQFIMNVDIVFFKFLMLGIHWVSWICSFRDLSTLGNILAIISSNIYIYFFFFIILSAFSFPLPSGTPITCVRMLKVFLQITNAWLHFPRLFSVSFPSEFWVIYFCIFKLIIFNLRLHNIILYLHTSLYLWNLLLFSH